MFCCGTRNVTISAARIFCLRERHCPARMRQRLLGGGHDTPPPPHPPLMHPLPRTIPCPRPPPLFPPTAYACVWTPQARDNIGLAGGGQKVGQCRDKYKQWVENLIKLASLQTSFVTMDEALKVRRVARGVAEELLLYQGILFLLCLFRPWVDG